jgi:hypothetical protein
VTFGYRRPETPGCPRLEFPDISTDLRALAAAVGTGAGRFHLMLGDLARTNDTRPGVSLSHNPGSYAAE